MTQVYEIPAGREINELLWFQRAVLTDSIVDPFLGGFGGLGGAGFGSAGGFAQTGSAGSFFMMPAFDLLLSNKSTLIKNESMVNDLVSLKKLKVCLNNVLEEEKRNI